jgi:mannose-6-phosphate isomerase-like protein (cupin superfamily)
VNYQRPKIVVNKFMEFNEDIISLAAKNNDFRRVIVTGDHSQIVLMSIPSGEEIGEETHDVDQILFFVECGGRAVLNGKESLITPNHLVFVPAGTKHNFKNTCNTDMKLFAIYAPAEHKPGTVHKTEESSREGE